MYQNTIIPGCPSESASVSLSTAGFAQCHCGGWKVLRMNGKVWKGDLNLHVQCGLYTLLIASEYCVVARWFSLTMSKPHNCGKTMLRMGYVGQKLTANDGVVPLSQCGSLEGR